MTINKPQNRNKSAQEKIAKSVILPNIRGIRYVELFLFEYSPANLDLCEAKLNSVIPSLEFSISGCCVDMHDMRFNVWEHLTFVREISSLQTICTCVSVFL